MVPDVLAMNGARASGTMELNVRAFEFYEEGYQPTVQS